MIFCLYLSPNLRIFPFFLSLSSFSLVFFDPSNFSFMILDCVLTDTFDHTNCLLALSLSVSLSFAGLCLLAEQSGLFSRQVVPLALDPAFSSSTKRHIPIPSHISQPCLPRDLSSTPSGLPSQWRTSTPSSISGQSFKPSAATFGHSTRRKKCLGMGLITGHILPILINFHLFHHHPPTTPPTSTHHQKTTSLNLSLISSPFLSPSINTFQTTFLQNTWTTNSAPAAFARPPNACTTYSRHQR